MGVIGVRINDNGKLLFYKYDGLDIKRDSTVIVDTDKGFQYAKVVNINNSNEDNINIEKYDVIRLTTKKDYIQHLSNLKDAKLAVKKCRELVVKYDLDMYIIDAEYTFTRSQLIYRFLSDERVDFRQLAKDLGALFKTRIELRQIGVRDKAKEIGGVGPCGRRLCCNSFLNEFESVSINMAKNQSLSLNPSKINGVCGRLLCCLKYENDNYTLNKKGLPNVGENTSDGKVVSVDILNNRYKVLNDKNILVEMDGE